MAGSRYYVAAGRSIQLLQPTLRSMRHLVEREEIPSDLLPDRARLDLLIEHGFVVTERPAPSQPIPIIERASRQGLSILSPSMQRLYDSWRFSSGE